jgi:6-phosphofructokinase 1
MVNTLEDLGIDILFVIGGDGSQKGAADIDAEAQKRGLKLSVIGVPKTIDNDLRHVDKSFGYETAFSVATHAVKSAHTEARGSRNGVGLVKLMGRDSGFLAASAAIATGDVNFVLVPEVPFSLHGEHGLLESLRRRLELRQHAVIVVAEGAGQELFAAANLGTDASGNAKYGDIGLLLKDQINAYFKERKIELNLKYIDPSYIVRSVPAQATDSLFCAQLGRHAVHAAMAGRTGMVAGRWHQRFVHLPIDLVTAGRRKIDTHGDFWVAALECTGQPLRMV